MKETKIVCPKCGTEFEIPEHEHVATGVVIGKDSGVGTIVLKEAEAPVTKAQKRLEALKGAGVDISSLFAMQTGEIARNDNGVLSVLSDDDPIFQSIIAGGTIPDRHLFRRWVMAQMFHMLVGDFTQNLRSKGYEYQWRVIEDELRVQKRLFRNDPENYYERNMWFNRRVVSDICKGYTKQLDNHINYLKKKKVKHCKGVPYVHIVGKNIFVSDLFGKVQAPLNRAVSKIDRATTPDELYRAFMNFKKAYAKVREMRMNTCFIDSYKGVGAYYTMKNMILFHGCVFYTTVAGKRRKMTKDDSLRYLKDKAKEYSQGYDGWRLFGVMKELIADNKIDIKKKMAEWRKK